MKHEVGVRSQQPRCVNTQAKIIAFAGYGCSFGFYPAVFHDVR
jgi:hypothetical protein